jgi:hypothetical protein
VLDLAPSVRFRRPARILQGEEELDVEAGHVGGVVRSNVERFRYERKMVRNPTRGERKEGETHPPCPSTYPSCPPRQGCRADSRVSAKVERSVTEQYLVSVSRKEGEEEETNDAKFPELMLDRPIFIVQSVRIDELHERHGTGAVVGTCTDRKEEQRKEYSSI